MIFHENPLLANDSQENHTLFLSKTRKDVAKFVICCIHDWRLKDFNWSTSVYYIIGLARLIEISVNRSIYNRKTIIDMKFKKSVTFNRCSVHLFNKNSSVIASCDVLFRREVHCSKL